MSILQLVVLLSLVALVVNGFVVQTSTTFKRMTLMQASAADDLFASEGWGPIQQDLDQVPVFTVATQEGNPLAYTVQMGDNKFNVPCFYCDVEAAKTELEEAKDNGGLEGLDLIPFPLGKAFQMWAKDEAVIVPGKDAILQAGAPPGTNPIGQQVPMFACMEIAEEQEDGSPKLPVFMSLEDANTAVELAVKADGGSTDDFEVVCLSLSGIIDQLATVPETPAFHFIPPSASMKYIQEYLS